MIKNEAMMGNANSAFEPNKYMTKYRFAKVYLAFSVFTYTIFSASYFAIEYWKVELFPAEHIINPVLRFVLHFTGNSIVVNNLIAWIIIPILIFKFYKQGSFLFKILCFISIALIVVWFYIASKDLAP